ncbi:serine/Arginine-related protein 53-like [Physella acuta]|uniref:serine/Arginine-related protein 53-like n=1 Tax=Physella acuta TaxID=109671 RepID=UPI0027DE9A8E|nr:serine/Arginine-related protein 53-like [Physella acuta]
MKTTLESQGRRKRRELSLVTTVTPAITPATETKSQRRDIEVAALTESGQLNPGPPEDRGQGQTAWINTSAKEVVPGQPVLINMSVGNHAQGHGLQTGEPRAGRGHHHPGGQDQGPGHRLAGEGQGPTQEAEGQNLPLATVGGPTRGSVTEGQGLTTEQIHSGNIKHLVPCRITQFLSNIRVGRAYSRERDRRSRSYDRTNSLSRSSTEARRDTSHSRGSPNVNVKGLSITDVSPGFSNMTPSEQAEERMRLALKAAAAADEKLRVREIPSAVSVAASLAESQAFASSVAAIESNSFVQSVFKTSRAKTKMDEVTDTQASHDDAIFGSLSVSGFTIKPDPDMKPLQLDSESIMHPSLYCDPEEKMNKWIHRLTQLRQRKLEGEVMQ